MRNFKERTCKICGNSFKPYSASQVCCDEECMAVNKKILEEQKRKRAKAKKEYQRSMMKPKTNWAEIIRKCEAAGLSYGEATARGII